ncbi:MAG: hypothetical protein Q8L49_14760 [Burkholderiaceae bacterium]|nr:hypothetical protein [Burkholderiaceae bacterium]
MHASSHAANPFDMLINPQAILDAIEHSTHLQALDRKICRPLDKVSAPQPVQGDDVAAFDAALDRQSGRGSL